MTNVYRNHALPAKHLLLGCLLLATSARGQHYRHFTLWSRVQVKKEFNDRWDLASEFHYRRQSNYRHGQYNFLDSPFLNAVRLIGSHHAGAWTFQLNPSFFYSHSLLGREEDFNVPAGGEWRLAAYAEWERTRQRFTLRVRPGYEYRLLERNDYAPTGRARLRVQGRCAVGERAEWVLSTEPMLNVGPNAVPVPFNQNQAYTGLDLDLLDWLGLEVGYLYVFRQRRTVVEFDNEHALNVQLKIQL